MCIYRLDTSADKLGPVVCLEQGGRTLSHRYSCYNSSRNRTYLLTSTPTPTPKIPLTTVTGHLRSLYNCPLTYVLQPQKQITYQGLLGDTFCLILDLCIKQGMENVRVLAVRGGGGGLNSSLCLIRLNTDPLCEECKHRDKLLCCEDERMATK